MGNITGSELIAWGFKPGKSFGAMLIEANKMAGSGANDEEIIAALAGMVPHEMVPRTNSLPISIFLEPENEIERENYAAVVSAMDALMRVPTITAGVIMPDACPAGTIPVGGVVAAKDAIHPGFHSADICCSMAITVLNRKDDPKRILDAAEKITHFGPGGRKGNAWDMPASIATGFAANRFLSDAIEIGNSNFGTQGDGNHFLYVGHLHSTGHPAIVTHHGSRGPGALLYKRGMALAKKHTSIVSPRTPSAAAWLDANSEEGRAYWSALQLIRLWTKASHFAIHDQIARTLGNRIVDRFWNEHNFVFRRDDGQYHEYRGNSDNPRRRGSGCSCQPDVYWCAGSSHSG